MSSSRVSALTRGAGMAADVWTRLDRAIKAQGGTDEDLHLLAREEGQPMIDQIASLLVRAGAATRNVFYLVTIDYGQTIDQMIEAGKYDWHNDSITAENFPIEGNGIIKTEVVLVHFDRDISSENAIKEMEQMGLEPAETEHLLAYGAQHWQRDPELVVALGSFWASPRGDRRVPVSAWLRRPPWAPPGLVRRWLGWPLAFPRRPQVVIWTLGYFGLFGCLVSLPVAAFRVFSESGFSFLDF